MIVTANLGADNERYERQGRQDERLWSPHQTRNDKSYHRKEVHVHPQLEGVTDIDVRLRMSVKPELRRVWKNEAEVT